MSGMKAYHTIFPFIAAAGNHRAYGPSMLPSDLQACYRRLQIPLPGHATVQADVWRYRNVAPGCTCPGAGCPRCQAQKDALLHRLREYWARGELLDAQKWGSQGGHGRIAAAFVGKALPEEMSYTARLAVETGLVPAGGVRQWASDNFGLDCSGFVNALFIVRGGVTAERSIRDYYDHGRRAIRDPDYIREGCILIWSDFGHIALVNQWVDPPRGRFNVTESACSLMGLGTGVYEIIRAPSATTGSALWQVRRPPKPDGARDQSEVYILPPPNEAARPAWSE